MDIICIAIDYGFTIGAGRGWGYRYIRSEVSPCFSYVISLVCTVDLGPIDRNVYNETDLIAKDCYHRQISLWFLLSFYVYNLNAVTANQ